MAEYISGGFVSSTTSSFVHLCVVVLCAAVTNIYFSLGKLYVFRYAVCLSALTCSMSSFMCMRAVFPVCCMQYFSVQAARLMRAPTLFLSGLDDQLVPAWMMEQLFQVSSQTRLTGSECCPEAF